MQYGGVPNDSLELLSSDMSQNQPSRKWMELVWRSFFSICLKTEAIQDDVSIVPSCDHDIDWSLAATRKRSRLTRASKQSTERIVVLPSENKDKQVNDFLVNVPNRMHVDG